MTRAAQAPERVNPVYLIYIGKILPKYCQNIAKIRQTGSDGGSGKAAWRHTKMYFPICVVIKLMAKSNLDEHRVLESSLNKAVVVVDVVNYEFNLF